MTEIPKWKQQPYVSIGLVLINIIIFIMCLFDGGRLYSVGSLSLVAVLQNKEYIRIISSIFLHADTTHLFNNMILLLFTGAMIEKELGHITYGVLYLCSGVGGNLFSLIYKIAKRTLSASIGASGAVFGLEGALLAILLLDRKRLPRVTPGKAFGMIMFSLYCGFATSNVDNAAHVGGLITGFVLGCLACIILRCRKDNYNTEERYEY